MASLFLQRARDGLLLKIIEDATVSGVFGLGVPLHSSISLILVEAIRIRRSAAVVVNQFQTETLVCWRFLCWIERLHCDYIITWASCVYKFGLPASCRRL